MALAEATAFVACALENSGTLAAEARALAGEPNPCDALRGRAFTGPELRPAPPELYIATDDEPRDVQPWPPGIPAPLGWHLVTPTEARILTQGPAAALSLAALRGGVDLPSQVAALTVAGPSPDVASDRRPPRAPREPRPPRAPRQPRAPRSIRPARPDRPPRPRRPARPPRPPRAKRPPRPRRPRSRKTHEPPGVCKGPGCHCWTPAGCVGPWYLELIPTFKASDCYKGPCYDYTACVSDKCGIHLDCLSETIFQFWARAFHQIAVNPLQFAQDTAAGALGVVNLARRTLVQAAAQFELIAPSVDGVTEGCPPGTRWAVGLTGYSCQSPATHPIAATREELIAAGILRA